MDAPINKKKNHSSLSPIEVVSDELLIEFFIRLPSYKTAITCKFVSKHWLSLLSNPKFVVDFLNHKKTQSQSQSIQPLPWTFLSTMRLQKRTRTTTTTTMTTSVNKKKTTMKITEIGGNYKFPTHKVFSSPKFTLNFLPFPFKVVATFKDLILCINTTSSGRGCNDYCICNPVTKQWLALPSTPTPLDHEKSWASLICEDPYYDATRCRCDCRFRVVVIHPKPKLPNGSIQYYPLHLFNLLVFCSETFQWKSLNLSVALHRSTDVNFVPLHRVSFFGLVCNGMVIVRYNAYFGMFNPFDVTCATLDGTTLEAIVLPLYGDGQIFECGKQLVKISKSPTMRSCKDYQDLIQLSMRNLFCELNDVNEVRKCWIMYFIGRCFDNAGLLPLSTKSRGIIGMHPSNNQLFYLLTAENEVVLCDMGLRSLKFLGILHPDHFESSARLELQYWPTPLPQMGDQ